MTDKNIEEKLEYAKDLVINSISETMDLYGVTPSVGRLYGAMFFHQHPMTLDEMKDELGMSKPSMSTAVRNLQENEMVQKSWKKGSRKDMYTAEKDFFKNFIHFFCKKWEKEVHVNEEASYKAQKLLMEIIEDPEASLEVRESAQSYYNSIEESLVYYKWLERLVNSCRSGKIFEFLPKEETNEEKK